MRLERRILLLIIMSVLLPGLLANYSRLVLDTHTKLGLEEQRGISFARYVVTTSGPQRGALDAGNIARFRLEHGLLHIELCRPEPEKRVLKVPIRTGA